MKKHFFLLFIMTNSTQTMQERSPSPTKELSENCTIYQIINEITESVNPTVFTYTFSENERPLLRASNREKQLLSQRKSLSTLPLNIAQLRKSAPFTKKKDTLPVIIESNQESENNEKIITTKKELKMTKKMSFILATLQQHDISLKDLNTMYLQIKQFPLNNSFRKKYYPIIIKKRNAKLISALGGSSEKSSSTEEYSD